MSMEDLSHTADDGAPAFIDILGDICGRLELDHAALGVFLPGSDKLHAYGTYPTEFVQHYAAHDLYEIDPTIDIARQSMVPYDLSRMRDHPGYIPIFVDCARFGIPSNGMSFPLHGADGSWGVFNALKDCTDSEWARFIARKAPSLHFLGLHLFESARTSLIGGTSPVFDILPPRLCPAEIAMLQGVARGLPVADVARARGISPRCGESHLKGATLKMQAVSPEHAAARAQGLGLF